MKYPDKKQALILLDEWQKMQISLYALFDGMRPAFGSLVETSLFETTWRLFDAYTVALSARLGDTTFEPWMQWYAFENGMGTKKYPAGYDGKVKPIKNLSDLYGLILIARGRGQ